MLPAFTCTACLRMYDQASDARDCEIDHETDAEHGMPDDRLQ